MHCPKTALSSTMNLASACMHSRMIALLGTKGFVSETCYMLMFASECSGLVSGFALEQ